MKWMVLAGVSLAVMACSSPDEMSEDIGEAATNAPEAAQGADDAGERLTIVEGGERTIEIDKEALTFTYFWPAQAQAIEGLSAELEKRAEADKAEYSAYAQNAKADADEGDYTFMRHSYSAGWEVAADLPGYLSLGGGRSTYTGGAHGNSDYDSLVWDRKAGKALSPVDLFTSPEAIDQAVREPYCTALKDERSKRLGPEIVLNLGVYDGCPPLSELALVLMSKNGVTFDTMELIAAPYVAGAYAEGAYIIALPVTDAVRAAAKPEHKDAFAAE